MSQTASIIYQKTSLKKNNNYDAGIAKKIEFNTWFKSWENFNPSHCFKWCFTTLSNISIANSRLYLFSLLLMLDVNVVINVQFCKANSRYEWSKSGYKSVVLRFGL